MSALRGPKRSTGTPPIGPSNAPSNDHDSDNSAICAGPASYLYAAYPHSATSAHQLPMPLTACPARGSTKRRSRSGDIATTVVAVQFEGAEIYALARWL